MINISGNEDVDDLRTAIKTTCQISHPSHSLVLYKVAIPYSPQLAKNATALELNDLKLNPVDKLSKVFENGILDEHVHVIVRIPGVWVYVILTIIMLTCFADPQISPCEFLVFKYSQQFLTLHSYPCSTTIQKAEVRL